MNNMRGAKALFLWVWMESNHLHRSYKDRVLTGELQTRLILQQYIIQLNEGKGIFGTQPSSLITLLAEKSLILPHLHHVHI
jgi:hypothetical protein